MSALAEALVAAQARAVAALGKQYVGGTIDNGEVCAALEAIGLTDGVDTARLLAAWDVLRDAGAPAPGEQTNGAPKPAEKASGAQVSLIQKMLREREQTPLAEQDLRNLTKARASQLIDAIGAGTYDPAEWDVAF